MLPPYVGRRQILLAAGLWACIQATPATAQSTGSGLLDISADELEVQNRTCVSTWRGNAQATRGQARLVADMLRAHLQPQAGARPASGTAACGDVLRIEAHGSVHYVTARGQRVRGDHGVYDLTTGEVTITGDVIAIDGENVLRGSRMTFNNETGYGRVTGAPNTRPRGVFRTRERTGPSAPDRRQDLVPLGGVREPVGPS